MNPATQTFIQQAVQAMDEADCGGAIMALDFLMKAIHQDSERAPLDDLWAPFERLLHRRGYFIGSGEDLQGSLSEIHSLGEGFDLFDLADVMARCDVHVAECGRPKLDRRFPALQAFRPHCACDGKE